MKNNIINGAVALSLVGAGFVGGSASSIQAETIKTIDATRAANVQEVRISEKITAPVTTEISYTINDLISEIEMKDRELNRCTTIQSEKEALLLKKQAAFIDSQIKFDEEVAKREAEKEVVDKGIVEFSR